MTRVLLTSLPAKARLCFREKRTFVLRRKLILLVDVSPRGSLFAAGDFRREARRT
jgi:hypothetical protein